MGQLAEFTGNHPYLILGLVGAWGAVMFYEFRLKARGITQVSATDAVRLINGGAIVVDVRNAEAYETGHIVNARNISLDELQDKLKKHKKLYTSKTKISSFFSGVLKTKNKNCVKAILLW